MTRRFIDDIRADITNLMADNTTGDITPAITRGILTDMCDSLIQDEAGIILATPPVLNYAIGTGFTLVQAYDTAVGGDGIWLKPDFPGGQIELNAQPGWTYEIWGGITFEGANNRRYAASISVDGVPSDYLQGETGQGVGNPVSLAVRSYIPANTANARIGISMQGEIAGTINIAACALLVKIMPTNNP